MGYKITCPYCFKEMMDNEVAFRSDVVNKGVPDILPVEYTDVEDFQQRYRGDDKEYLLAKLRDWYFFEEGSDSEYEAFWSRFNGTTELNPADKILGVEAFRRKVIDPLNTEHQRYIRRQTNGEYYLYDQQGMADRIELLSGETCNRRVCRHCHNPLPDNYGKNPVKFAAVVGITGAGKTVYLSQLLRRIKEYVTKVGLDTDRSSSARLFIENNRVSAGQPLPGSTPSQQLQQPLFFNVKKPLEDNKILTNTFVLYDVAGEVFTDEDLVERFAPFIGHADGVIVLIDPLQFEVISGVSAEGRTLGDPTIVLDIINNIVNHGNVTEKCPVPFAICMAKADMPEVQAVFSNELKTALLNDVEAVAEEPLFNAEQYAPIAKELSKFIRTNDHVLAHQMKSAYASYAYFAFTALGCSVKEGVDESSNLTFQYPEGPVLPKRIEEPLLWLFYKLGYIGRHGSIPGEIYCPICGSNDNHELRGDDCTITERYGLFGLKKRTLAVNRHCRACDHFWEHTDTEE